MLFAVPPLVTTLLGVALLVWVIGDILTTAVMVSGGAGSIARNVSKGLWRPILNLHERRPQHRMLRYAGPTILFAILIAWLVLLILGWALIFNRESSLVEISTGDATAPLGRVYFAAATILGRGAGGLSPSDNSWQFIEQIAASMGVAFVGLSIAYILPAVNAVVNARHVAAYINTLGSTPREILEDAWDGKDFGELYLHFVALTPMITEISQQHLAYPVTHYFHSGNRSTALGPNIVALDETLTLLEDVVDRDLRIDPSSIRPLRRAINAFLSTLTRVSVVPSDEPLPRPDFDFFGDAPFNARDPDDIDSAYERLRDRRCLLRGFLRHDGWIVREEEAPDDAERHTELESHLVRDE